MQWYSNYNTIDGCNISNSYDSNVDIRDSDYNIINNSILSSANKGVTITYGGNNIIANTRMTNNWYTGIHFDYDTHDNTIISNYFDNNDNKDVQFSYNTMNNVFSGNEFQGGGIHDDSALNEYCSGERNIFGPGAEVPLQATMCDCTDNDGDGSYVYDPVDCLMGNDCNDNDPALIGVKSGTSINYDVTICPGTYHGSITFNTSGATLDCNGAEIVGNGDGNGIAIYSQDDNTIKNCKIVDYWYGIVLSDSDRNEILNTQILSTLSNYNTGLRLEYSSYNTIRNVSSYHNYGYGVDAYYADYNTFDNCNLSSNGDSNLYMSVSNFNTVNNSVMDSASHGIDIYNSYNNTITHSQLRGNSYQGISIGYAQFTRILSNYFDNNNDMEISLNAYASLISGNEFQGGGVQDYSSSTDYCSGEPNIFGPSATIPEGAQICDCVDNDGDGSFGYDPVDCTVGNDCNDNDASWIGVRDDITITQNVKICPGTYIVDDKLNNGVLIFGASGMTLDCNGASIHGTGSEWSATGWGIYMPSKTTISLRTAISAIIMMASTLPTLAETSPP